MMSTKNQQQQGRDTSMGMAAGGNVNNRWDWNKIGIKPGWVWERECEWEWTTGNESECDWKRHSRSSLDGWRCTWVWWMRHHVASSRRVNRSNKPMDRQRSVSVSLACWTSRVYYDDESRNGATVRNWRAKFFAARRCRCAVFGLPSFRRFAALFVLYVVGKAVF